MTDYKSILKIIKTKSEIPADFEKMVLEYDTHQHAYLSVAVEKQKEDFALFLAKLSLKNPELCPDKVMVIKLACHLENEKIIDGLLSLYKKSINEEIVHVVLDFYFKNDMLHKMDFIESVIPFEKWKKVAMDVASHTGSVNVLTYLYKKDPQLIENIKKDSFMWQLMPDGTRSFIERLEINKGLVNTKKKNTKVI